MTRRRGRLASIVAASIVLAAGAAVGVAAGAPDTMASGEGPATVVVGDSLPWFGFGFTPKELSRTEPSPARLDFELAFEHGGFMPPALSPVTVELDRQISIDGIGIPICGGFRVQDGVEPTSDCRGSIVGRGRETFAIRNPEQVPQHASGPVVVYYGGRRDGLTKLFAIGQLDGPISSSLDIEIDLEPISEGRFGTQASFSVPEIASGHGSIASLELVLFKRFAYHGTRRSFIGATCRDGKLVAAASAFRSPPSEGEVPLEEPSVRACTPRR